MKKIIQSILFLVSLALAAQAQELPKPPKYKIGLTYVGNYNEFRLGIQPIKPQKSILTKSEIGLKVFALRDKIIRHRSITNYYIEHKNYRFDFTFWDIWFGGGTYTEIPGNVISGKKTNRYGGFYPIFAIPVAQTYCINFKYKARLKPIIGLGWSATLLHGRNVSGQSNVIKVLDDTKHDEIVKVKEIIQTSGVLKLVFGINQNIGLEYRITRKLFVSLFATRNYSINPTGSSIDHASLTTFSYLYNMSVSKQL